MKKLVSIFMVLLLVLSASFFTASAEDGTTTDYRYNTKFFTSKLFYNDLSLIADEYCAVPGLYNTDVAGKKLLCC